MRLGFSLRNIATARANVAAVDSLSHEEVKAAAWREWNGAMSRVAILVRRKTAFFLEPKFGYSRLQTVSVSHDRLGTGIGNAETKEAFSAGAKNGIFFESFPYVCPEPVLAK